MIPIRGSATLAKAMQIIKEKTAGLDYKTSYGKQSLRNCKGNRFHL